jgi:hypothetical protein
MPASTIKITGNNIVMPVGGLVDGVDVGTAVPAAQSTADTALANAAAALAAANEADDTADAAQATANAAAPATRAINTTAPLSGGGDFSADRTLTVAAVSNTSAGVVPQHAGAADEGKSLIATPTGSQWSDASVKLNCNWGTQAAPGVALARYFVRINNTLDALFQRGEYVVPFTGTFTFVLTWRVGGTPLDTDSAVLTVMLSGVATGLTSTIAPLTASGQASLAIAVTQGDGVCIRVVQSGTEAEANWNPSIHLRAI